VVGGKMSFMYKPDSHGKITGNLKLIKWQPPYNTYNFTYSNQNNFDCILISGNAGSEFIINTPKNGDLQIKF
jgi:hypothetical protein